MSCGQTSASCLKLQTSLRKQCRRRAAANSAKMENPHLKKVGVLITYPMLPYMVESLDRKFTTFKLWEAQNPHKYLAENAHCIRGVACNGKAGANAELIDALLCLEIVVTHSVGLDKVDLAKCRERNIVVAYTPDVVTDDVADLAIALMLGALRRIPSADRYVRQGLWKSQGNFVLTSKLSGKRVAIVGLGRIGMAIAKRAEAFGCSISYHSRSQKSDVSFTYHSNLIELAANSDILVVACPLTKETHHIINKSVLDALGKKGTLVNIARGPVVDEKELVKALIEGRLGGAGLDVFENEPIVPKELFSMDNVVLLPHVGTATCETRKLMADLVIGNLEAHFSNKPLLTPVHL